jgi:hypothetical protein
MTPAIVIEIYPKTPWQSGHHLKGIKIEGVTSGEHPQAFYDLTLADVTIGKTHEQNGGGDVLTFDNYSKIFLETHGQNSDGSLSPADTFAWDVTNSMLIHSAFGLS